MAVPPTPSFRSEQGDLASKGEGISLPDVSVSSPSRDRWTQQPRSGSGLRRVSPLPSTRGRAFFYPYFRGELASACPLLTPLRLRERRDLATARRQLRKRGRPLRPRVPRNETSRCRFRTPRFAGRPLGRLLRCLSAALPFRVPGRGFRLCEGSARQLPHYRAGPGRCRMSLPLPSIGLERREPLAGPFHGEDRQKPPQNLFPPGD